MLRYGSATDHINVVQKRVASEFVWVINVYVSMQATSQREEVLYGIMHGIPIRKP